ncbi:MAG: toxin-antitoxin system HicB family antitoxin [Lachnospiraceae bacterium]|nr:toxin-antitoxin system HicB family antitoxin [Lachnospiraceae bacterium]
MKSKSLEYYLGLPYRIEIIPDTVEGGYTASYPDLPGCLTCSETMDGIIANAQDAKRAWLEAAIADGIEIPEPLVEDVAEYSGQFKLRMPKSLHRSLAVHAKKEGTSMNQYCVYLLSMNDAKHVTTGA